MRAAGRRWGGIAWGGVAAIVVVAGCKDAPGSAIAPGASAEPGSPVVPAVSSSGGSTGDAAVGGAEPAEALGEWGKIPVEAAVRARAALAGAKAKGNAEGAEYRAFRRAVACGEPFWLGRGFVTEALFGAGQGDETGGPLGRLDVALASGDGGEIEARAVEVDRALQLIEDSFRRSPAGRTAAATLLPRAAFQLGAILAGSKPGLAQTAAGVVADALGLLDALERGTAAYSQLVSPSREFGAAATRVGEGMTALRRALEAAEVAGDLSGRAALVLQTGKLGAALRALFGPGARAWRPYSPRGAEAGSDAGDPGEPTSVLTVPALRRVTGKLDKAEEERLASAGERLFADKGLSAGGVRSCATCHVPDKGYADGKARAASLDPATPSLRHTPTLLYSALHAVQFWDGRALTSESQALLVLHSKAEMGDTSKAFPRAGFARIEDAARALAVFEAARLSPASSPLDRFARGDEQALSAEDRAGFDVFAGKGRCARCHVPPLFGGAYPTDFATPIYAALGVPETPAGKALDGDPGRFGVTHRARDQGAFKTPTVRDAGVTAPYFHNGAYPTLELVVDFYDKGGGRGLGLTVVSQDPEVRPLRLTAAEKSALLRFLRVALRDEKAARAR